MPPLQNPRHEAFVQKLVKPGAPSYLNLKRSYQETYPTASPLTAESNSSRLVRDAKTHERFLELMEKKGLTDDSFNDVHKKFLHNQDGNVAYKFLRLGHELKGRLGNKNTEQKSNQPNVTFIQNNFSSAISHINDMLT